MENQDQKSLVERLNEAGLTREDFKLSPEAAAEIKRRDELEYRARHPELFPEYNFRVG